MLVALFGSALDLSFSVANRRYGLIVMQTGTLFSKLVNHYIHTSSLSNALAFGGTVQVSSYCAVQTLVFIRLYNAQGGRLRGFKNCAFYLGVWQCRIAYGLPGTLKL